ncbi:MAG: hypothetical protein IPK82_34690 [Polyangiaceae bacterium]|nr:hypothetical protein [Polyangiaceae bacterium]
MSFDAGLVAPYSAPDMRLLGLLAAAASLFGTVGCAATVVEPSPDGGTATTTAALISLQSAARDGKEARTSISAKFLRAPVSADADAIESLVGSDFELPAPGECSVVQDADPVGPESPAAFAIELFDVGDVTIRTRASAIPLAARAFPDVGDRVSGMFYTSPDTRGNLPAPGKYIVEGSGSQGVERFSVEADAPQVPSDISVNGTPLFDGVEWLGGTDLQLSWRVGENKDDIAYVELITENGFTARCAFEDRGRGTVPASLIRGVVFGAAPVGATLAVHRVRQGTFQVPGIDLGEVRFDVSVVSAITLAPQRTGDIAGP